MSETESDNPDGGIATLAADAVDDFNTEAPYSVSGVALPVNTVVNGGQNTKHVYPAEVLKSAADMLEGQQIVKNFHDLDGQANADQVIGKITNAGFQKGVGLVFSGEIVDESVAEKVAHGFLDVSPTVARELGEFDEAMGAQQVNRISGFRDLAVVANGQPGASIEPGDNPAITALSMDALSRGFDVLQSDLDLVPPETAAENARRGLECVEEVDTDAGEAQGRDTARAIIDAVENDDPLSEDMVSEIASFDRHRAQGNDELDAENEGTPCEDNGWVSWKLWGGDAGVDWAQRKNDQLDDEDTMTRDTLQRDTARRPTFDGTETSEEQAWGDVSKDLSDVTDALNIDAETVEDMTDTERSTVAELTLLGDTDADSWGALYFFPVVNPNTMNLNEGALNAVRGGRGAQADIPADAYSDAEAMAEELLAEEFEGYEMEDGELTTMSAEVVPVVESVPVEERPAGEVVQFKEQ